MDDFIYDLLCTEHSIGCRGLPGFGLTLTLTPTGPAYAASGAWRAQGRASHALCLAGSPMGWPSYMKGIVYACATVRAVWLCLYAYYMHFIMLRDGFDGDGGLTRSRSMRRLTSG